jgi:hypothetical protein
MLSSASKDLPDLRFAGLSCLNVGSGLPGSRAAGALSVGRASLHVLKLPDAVSPVDLC